MIAVGAAVRSHAPATWTRFSTDRRTRSLPVITESCRDQGRRRGRGRARGRPAAHPQLRPHRRARARGGHPVPPLPPRGSGRLRHAGGAASSRAARGRARRGDRQALADLLASLGPLPADRRPRCRRRSSRPRSTTRRWSPARLHFVLPTAHRRDDDRRRCRREARCGLAPAAAIRASGRRLERPAALEACEVFASFEPAAALWRDLQQLARRGRVIPSRVVERLLNLAPLDFASDARRDTSGSVPDRSISSHGSRARPPAPRATASPDARFRCCAWIVSPSARITARSMQFCSSRTLPGQRVGAAAPRWPTSDRCGGRLFCSRQNRSTK